MELELTSCPDCGQPAEVIERLPWGVDKPVEYVKTRCITGPWFLTPVIGDPRDPFVLATGHARS